ncbi:MAG: GHKL domain-containing protein [Evtepia sp.]
MKEKFVPGGRSPILTLLGTAVMLFILFLVGVLFLSLQNTNVTDLYLGDTDSKSQGWQYELLSEGQVQAVVPHYADEYTQIFPDVPIQAIKITRRMTETIAGATLCIAPFQGQAEVFLDQQLLYTDFAYAERGENGYLLVDDADFRPLSDEAREITLTLPERYTGSELSIITYFPGGHDIAHIPTFPLLSNGERQASGYVIGMLMPMTVIIISTILLVVLGIVFLIGMRADRPDFTILLMVLFYVLLLLDTASSSIFGIYSSVIHQINPLMVHGLCITVLCIYIAIKLTGWRRGILFLAITGQVLMDGIIVVYSWVQGNQYDLNQNGIAIFLMLTLTILLIVCEYHRHPQKIGTYFNFKYGLIVFLTFFILCLIQSANFDNLPMYFGAIFSGIRQGNCKAAVTLLTSFFAALTTMMLILAFVRRMIETQRMLDVLQTRSESAMASYRMMQVATEQTRAAQHELRHHVLALAGMMKEGKTEQTLQYIATLQNSIESLPTAKYSDNFLVNVVVGNYLEQAKARGISVKHHLSLPIQIGIEDSDLCVLLTNMLENALEACEQVPEAANKYIYIQVWKNDKFLFISCRNSYYNCIAPDGTYKSMKSDHGYHGYGLPAMRTIAEKYNSIIKIEYTQDMFSVKTNLQLPE